MKLKKYLDTTGISIAKFARACEINENTMNTYVNGKTEPGLRNALRIEKKSLGAVTLKDLILKKNNSTK